MATIQIDQLAETIESVLLDFAGLVEEALARAVDKTAREADEEIQRHIGFENRTGDYVKAFSLLRNKKKGKWYFKKWYVEAPQSNLTHLLENGHLNVDGSRTKAFPHIHYGEKLAQRNLLEQFKKELGR